MSVDGFIKGYKDVPSLAQISKHVNGKGATGETDKMEKSEINAIKDDEATKATMETAPVPEPARAAIEKTSETPSIVEPKTEERIKSESGEHPLEHTW